MLNLRQALLAAILVTPMSVMAQTTVTTSGGTLNRIPVFTGTATLGLSNITAAGGYVGIGTTSPSSLLTVGGTQFTVNSYGNMQISVTGGSTSGTYNRALIAINNQTTSTARLHGMYTEAIANSNVISEYVAGIEERGISMAPSGTTVGSVIGDKPQMVNMGNGTVTNAYALQVGLSASYNGSTGTITNAYGAYISGIFTGNLATVNNGYSLYVNAPDASVSNRYSIYQVGTAPNYFAGSIGVGTSTPGAALDVNGNVKVSGAGASITFPDGSVQTTAYTGVTCGGGDYAEAVDVTGDRTNYEPGDVLVIDTNAPGRFLKANEAYSSLVAGIYSTKPGVVGRRQTSDPKTTKTEIPMAMVGIVPTKVTAENGPIRIGDLLVASPSMGRAMKGTDRSLLTGAVIGKALGSLDSGIGVIEVLVTLQ